MTTSLVSSWEYRDTDRLLHFLPLYHLHGLLNKLLCVLWAGGGVEFTPSAVRAMMDTHPCTNAHHLIALITPLFAQAPAQLWRALAARARAPGPPLTLFMAVPTVYARLIEAATHPTDAAATLPPDVLHHATAALRGCRMHACGSAALPDTIMDGWRGLTGHTLLEVGIRLN